MGKSSLILEVLKPYLADTGGFFVQRLMKDGVCHAFCVEKPGFGITPLRPYQDNPRIFIERTKNGWKADEERFFAAAMECLQDYEEKKLILLDEIGGIELASAPFMRLLQRIFESGIPCMGVLKSDESFAKMADTLDTGRSLLERRRELMQGIEKHPGKIFTLTGENRAEIKTALKNFAKDCF